MPLSVSLNRATTVAQEARSIFLSFPEVSMVLSQVGRPDDGTDATGFFNAEFLVDLKPPDLGPPQLNKTELERRMDQQLRDARPRVSVGYSHYSKNNPREVLSRAKA